MVTAVTSLGRSGLCDWLIQRVSAIILAAYTIYIVAFIFTTPELTYEVWSAQFDQLWMRVFSLLALLSVAGHAWVGLWVVLTDYVNSHMMGPKALSIRMIALGLYALVTISYVVWGFEILWGN